MVQKVEQDKQQVQVWANADNPEDAEIAKRLGARGIGLCKTEQRFRGKDRLPFTRQMILAAPEVRKLRLRVENLRSQIEEPRNLAQRDKLQLRLDQAESEKVQSSSQRDYESALAELLPFQREDFSSIFRIMDGLPIAIRLLDSPLHEFLQKRDGLLTRSTELKYTSPDSAELLEVQKELEITGIIRESNPIMGQRGSRLGFMYPEIPEMQVRAITEAAAQSQLEGIAGNPIIIIPLVSHSYELADALRGAKALVSNTAQRVMEKMGVKVNYGLGVVIGAPRAALVADELASLVDFFAIDTDYLTGMTYAMDFQDSRHIIEKYIGGGIYSADPFQTIDLKGVGKLIKMAVELGRAANPKLKFGAWGRLIDDRDSIRFLHELGIDYISTSPEKVPAARLVAAQTA